MQLKSYFPGRVEAAMELAQRAYEVVPWVVNRPRTPEVLKSPKPSEEPNERARELAFTPGRLEPLLKSSLFEQWAAA
jgi:hypothetical protein